MDIKGIRSTAFGFALLTFAGGALATVTIDEDGNGFVGKGDVQLAFDWNNAQLQENAGLLQFRYASSGTATWKCEGLNPQGKKVVDEYETTTAVAQGLAFDPRKNKQGQITGFNLGGFIGAGSTTEPGTCPPKGHNWVQQPVLVGDINYEGSEDAALQVSTDETEWHTLIITY